MLTTSQYMFLTTMGQGGAFTVYANILSAAVVLVVVPPFLNVVKVYLAVRAETSEADFCFGTNFCSIFYRCLNEIIALV